MEPPKLYVNAQQYAAFKKAGFDMRHFVETDPLFYCECTADKNPCDPCSRRKP